MFVLGGSEALCFAVCPLSEAFRSKKIYGMIFMSWYNIVCWGTYIGVLISWRCGWRYPGFFRDGMRPSGEKVLTCALMGGGSPLCFSHMKMHLII